MLSIGKYIGKLRHQRGDTVGEVAAFLGISQDLLSKIERGQRNPTKDLVIKLASYFGADETKMWMTSLNDRILQPGPKEIASKRLQKIAYELSQLSTRKILARIHKPSSPLDMYIESIIYYSGNNKMYPYERAFPDGAVQLVIELDGNKRTLMAGNGTSSPVSLQKAWIAGVQRQHSTFQLEPHERTLSVRFTKNGFYALTHIPVSEIKDYFVDAGLIFGSSVSSLREHLLCCTDIDGIFQLVEQFFLNEISSPNEGFSLVQYVIDHIDTPLSELAHKTGYSHKHMILLFKKYVGVSPKYFQRIRRFNHVVDDILTKTLEVDWPDIVFAHGYYDQPHFIKEFNHFAGMNPSSYLKTGSTCSKLLHLNQIR